MPARLSALTIPGMAICESAVSAAMSTGRWTWNLGQRRVFMGCRGLGVNPIMVPRLFEDLKMAEVNGARQSESDQADRYRSQTSAPLARFVAAVGGNPQLLHPVRLGNVFVHRQRDDGLELASVFLSQRYEAEWLQRIANRIEEFSPGQDGSRTKQEHHFYLGTLRQRTWQREQAASQRNHLKFSGNTTAAIKPKDDRSVVFQMNARSTWN